MVHGGESARVLSEEATSRIQVPWTGRGHSRQKDAVGPERQGEREQITASRTQCTWYLQTLSVPASWFYCDQNFQQSAHDLDKGDTLLMRKRLVSFCDERAPVNTHEEKYCHH